MVLDGCHKERGDNTYLDSVFDTFFCLQFVVDCSHTFGIFQNTDFLKI